MESRLRKSKRLGIHAKRQGRSGELRAMWVLGRHNLVAVRANQVDSWVLSSMRAERMSTRMAGFIETGMARGSLGLAQMYPVKRYEYVK